jgi:hypothetical protein
MKYYQEFIPTGSKFSDRIGEPDEFDAALGRIVLAFSILEDTTRIMILILANIEPMVGQIFAAELSFRQKIDVMGSLLHHRAFHSNESTNHAETRDQITELLALCRQAEELRNTYLHSSYSYSGQTRAKMSAKSKHGLRVQIESINPSLLLDVADYIVYAASGLETLPLPLDIADTVTDGEDFISYSKNETVIAKYKFGEVM